MNEFEKICPIMRQTTQHNFPDTIQLGDAFQVRGGSISKEASK